MSSLTTTTRTCVESANKQASKLKESSTTASERIHQMKELANPIKPASSSSNAPPRESVPAPPTSSAASKPTSSGFGQVSCLLLGPTTASVHDKSMAQARYLYSTLTNNAGALLAASSTTASKAAQSPSPTRVHGVQRKQAQFVDRQQRQAARAGGLPSAGTEAGQGSDQPLTKHHEQQLISLEDNDNVGKEEKPLRSSSPPSDREAKDEWKETRKQKRKRLTSTKSEVVRTGAGGHEFGSSSSSSDDDGDRDQGDFSFMKNKREKEDDNAFDDEDEELGPLPELSQSRKSSSGKTTTTMANDNEQQTQRVTPSIVESQFYSTDNQRRDSKTSATSRSNSISFDASPQQLQPSNTMDPAMHALWAQGADLDTGNGNFIVATRRRRSVHAVHQLHQQQQQLQQLQQQNRNLLNATATASAASGETTSKCYKIDERSSSRDSSTGFGGSGADIRSSFGGLIQKEQQQQRRLKRELRKLRATSSIDEASTYMGDGETPMTRNQRQSSGILKRKQLNNNNNKSSSRFVSKSATKSKSASCFVSSLQNKPTTTTQISAEDDDDVYYDKPTTSAANKEISKSTDMKEEKSSGNLIKEQYYHKEDYHNDDDDDDGDQDEDEDDDEVDDEREPGIEVEDDEDDEEELDAGEEEANEFENENSNERKDKGERFYYLSDAEYDVDELESSTSLLASLFDWNYPIFELHERYGDTILSKLSYRIFYDSGFFECKYTLTTKY